MTHKIDLLLALAKAALQQADYGTSMWEAYTEGAGKHIAHMCREAGMILATEEV